MTESPEEIRQSVSELIQQHDMEKAEREALAEKYEKAHMERLKLGYVPNTQYDWNRPIGKEKSVKTKKQLSTT